MAKSASKATKLVASMRSVSQASNFTLRKGSGSKSIKKTKAAKGSKREAPPLRSSTYMDEVDDLGEIGLRIFNGISACAFACIKHPGLYEEEFGY